MRNELKEFGKTDAIEVEDWDKFVALYAQVHRPVSAAMLKKGTGMQGPYRTEWANRIQYMELGNYNKMVLSSGKIIDEIACGEGKEAFMAWEDLSSSFARYIYF
jgi:hypothetical protein